MSDIHAQLRQAAEASGLSINELARQSGVNLSAVSRFMSGQRDLRLQSAAKLAAALNLELRPIPKSRQKGN